MWWSIARSYWKKNSNHKPEGAALGKVSGTGRGQSDFFSGRGVGGVPDFIQAESLILPFQSPPAARIAGTH